MRCFPRGPSEKCGMTTQACVVGWSYVNFILRFTSPGHHGHFNPFSTPGTPQYLRIHVFQLHPDGVDTSVVARRRPTAPYLSNSKKWGLLLPISKISWRPRPSYSCFSVQSSSNLPCSTLTLQFLKLQKPWLEPTLSRPPRGLSKKALERSSTGIFWAARGPGHSRVLPRGLMKVSSYMPKGLPY